MDNPTQKPEQNESAAVKFGGQWRPIETAPVENGFAALLFVPGIGTWQRPSKLPYMVVGVFDTNYFGGGHWVSDVADIEGYESTGDYIVHNPVHPTHWMPLPAPPVGDRDHASTSKTVA